MYVCMFTFVIFLSDRGSCFFTFFEHWFLVAVSLSSWAQTPLLERLVSSTDADFAKRVVNADKSAIAAVCHSSWSKKTHLRFANHVAWRVTAPGPSCFLIGSRPRFIPLSDSDADQSFWA